MQLLTFWLFQAEVSPETIDALVKHAMEAGTLGLHQDGDRVSVTLNPEIPPANEEEGGEDDDNDTSRVVYW